MRLLVVMSLSGALAAGLAGCGSTTSSSSAFQGEERAVAAVVDEISNAARSGDAGVICSRLFSAKLADSLADGKETCTNELEKSLDDADSFTLEVQDVTVTGDTATAKVKGEDGGRERVATFRFVKVDGSWRADAIS